MCNNTTCYTLEDITKAYECANRGIILPLFSEFTWSIPVRATLYLLALLWCFMGVAILADVFMCAIEKITSSTRKIKIASANQAGVEEIEIKVWNDTVANLTLMALGTSSPEILLSIIEIIGRGFKAGDLGPQCIVGSAAFNLLVITGVCVLAIDSSQVRLIKTMNVFFVTAVFSIVAYLWLIVVLVAITPNMVDLWEAIITLMLFPTLVITAYVTDKRFCCKKEKQGESLELGFDDAQTKLLEKYKKVWKAGKVDKKVIVEVLKEVCRHENLSDEDKAKLAAAKIAEEQTKDRAWYRVNATRYMFGGKTLEPRLNTQLSEVLLDMKDREGDSGLEPVAHRTLSSSFIDLSNKGEISVIEFATTSYAVLEREQHCKVSIHRYGKLDNEVNFRLETIDGSATAGEDYIPVKESLVFKPGQTVLEYVVQIIDDNVFEPDETFFMKLHLEPTETKAVLGKKSINMITIINDDEPGTIEFAHPSFVVKETCGKAFITVNRENGADGLVQVTWKTENMTAKHGTDYLGDEGVLVFEHGEISKDIDITIINDQEDEKDEHFKIILSEPTNGAKLGSKDKTVVTIVNDEDYHGILSRLATMAEQNVDALKVDNVTYAQQFQNAMNVNGGDIASATNLDYVMHFFTFGWKILFAIVPPVHICGGYLTFICSLMGMVMMTAIVGDLAAIFGCLCGLGDEITALTIVAMGTSVPDLFASKQAATMDKTADNSIGNVTGSNSVNVFLGLGLPWTMAAIYHYAVNGTSFPVPAGTLSFSVMLFTTLAVICIGLLIFRHYVFPKGELGGKAWFKYLTACTMFLMWFLYILISSLQIRGHIKSPF